MFARLFNSVMCLPGCSTYQSAQMSYLPCGKCCLFVRCLKRQIPWNLLITPIILKCFERIMLHHLLCQTKGKCYPLQFAYKRTMGVEDAVLSLLHGTYTHLDKVGCFVRILFIDYSALNTIQPHLLAETLVNLNVSPKLIVWLTSQVVRYHNVSSQVKTTSIDALQFV